jgi:hypothetical protein
MRIVCVTLASHLRSYKSKTNTTLSLNTILFSDEAGAEGTSRNTYSVKYLKTLSAMVMVLMRKTERTRTVQPLN